jgi:hypothetical protein
MIAFVFVSVDPAINNRNEGADYFEPGTNTLWHCWPIAYFASSVTTSGAFMVTTVFSNARHHR